MAWRIAQSLLTLLAEVNALHPDRYKGTDGGISGYTYGPGGIVVNPNNQSSHNINSAGVVCAFDITTGNYPGGISVAAGQALAEQIRIRVRDQPRGITFYGIHYMAPPYVAIAGPKICTYGTNWEWEHYNGSDPHTSHQHWSADWDVLPGGAPSGLADYDSTLPWNLTTITGQGSGITPIQEDDFMASIQELMDFQVDQVGGGKMTLGQLLQEYRPHVLQISEQISKVPDKLLDTVVDGVAGDKISMRQFLAEYRAHVIHLVADIAAEKAAGGASVNEIKQAVADGLATGVKVDATVTVAGGAK